MKGNTEQIGIIKNGHMSARNLEVFIDHRSDQSSAEESVIF